MPLGDRKVPIVRSFEQYRKSAKATLFPHPVFDAPILSNLIDWVLYNCAPIFYWPYNEQERLAYLGCYHIIPAVHPRGPYVGTHGRYLDPVIVGLTSLHEFAHNLFNYPYSLADLTSASFNRQMEEREWAASNFSEVICYYLVPELEKLTRDAFFRPSWYDRLQEMGITVMPKISQLQQWRESWIKDPEVWENVWAPGEKYAGLRSYMKRFVDGNEDFNTSRFQRLMRVKGFVDPGIPALSHISYLSALEGFTPPPAEFAQKNYERLQLFHIQLLYHFLGLPDPPQDFEEAVQRQDELSDESIDL